MFRYKLQYSFLGFHYSECVSLRFLCQSVTRITPLVYWVVEISYSVQSVVQKGNEVLKIA